MTFKQWIEAEPRKPPGMGHARYAADRRGCPFTQDHPVTVGRLQGFLVLLDGYHRAVQFWSSNDAAARLAVYVPLMTGEAAR